MSAYDLNNVRQRPLIKKSALKTPTGDLRPDQCFLVVPVSAWNELNNLRQEYNNALIALHKQYSLAVLNEINQYVPNVYYWSQTRHNYYAIGGANSIQNYGNPDALLTVSVGGVPKQLNYDNICPNSTDVVEQTPTDEELASRRKAYLRDIYGTPGPSEEAEVYVPVEAIYGPATTQSLYERR